MSKIYKYLEDLHKKYPPFDPTGWIPPTCRDRKDKDGTLYKNIRIGWNRTVWYDKKNPNEKWQGPFVGRTINEFLKMEDMTYVTT